MEEAEEAEAADASGCHDDSKMTFCYLMPSENVGEWEGMAQEVQAYGKSGVSCRSRLSRTESPTGVAWLPKQAS